MRARRVLYSAHFCRSLMESKLQSGITVIVDRYAYSGVAFSSAKGLDIEWCKVKALYVFCQYEVFFLLLTTY